MLETDTTRSVIEHLNHKAGPLYIFFGGIAGKLGMPPFEFYRAAQVLGSNRILVRDLNQAWYHRGLLGISDDLDVSFEYIRCRINRIQPENVVFVGNSMGGYAAILFCAALGVGRAIAFSPQTQIGAGDRDLIGDRRWAQQIDALHRDVPDAPTFNLGRWLERTRPKIRANIYVSNRDRLDLAHASAMEKFENIRIHRFSEGGHELVAHLRNIGLLSRILSNEFPGTNSS